MADPDPIFVPCPLCNGSAVMVVPSRHFHSKWDVDPPEYYNEEVPCPECEGSGEVQTEGEPITLEELDQAHP